MGEKRGHVDKALAARLRAFFGGKVCVLTDDDAEVEWHHLNEIATKAETFFENLIPLRADLNKWLDTDKRSEKSNPKRELYLESIDGASRWRFDRGEHARGYGCARLGAFVAFGHYRNMDAALRFGARALLQARAINAVMLATDTILRSVIPSLERQLQQDLPFPSGPSAMVAIEVAGYYQEAGDPSRYLRWSELAHALLPRDSHDDVVVSNARLVFKDSVSFVAQRSADAAHKLEAAQTAVPDGHRFGNTNIELWTVRDFLLRGQIDRADEVLSRLEKKYGGLDGDELIHAGHAQGSWALWAMGERLLVNAGLRLRMGQHDGAMDYARRAYDLFRTSRIVPGNIVQDPVLVDYQVRYVKDKMLWVPRRSLPDLDEFSVAAERLWRPLSRAIALRKLTVEL